MSESTTDTPTTGKDVGGPMYSEGTQRLLHPDVPLRPSDREVLNEINTGRFRDLDEKPAASGPVYLVRPHVPAEQQEIIDLNTRRNEKLRKAERAADELREHLKAFRRSDREGKTAKWASANISLMNLCIDRLQGFHNDVAVVLGYGETFTRANPSESRLHMLTDDAVHTVPHFVQFTMALRGQSAYEYFNEPAGVRRGLELNVTNALKVIGCTLTPTPTACDHTTPACDHVPGAAEKHDPQQSFEDSAGERDPGAEADLEALRHETAVRAQYAVGSMSKDARRGLLDIIATLHPKLVLDAITDVNTARRRLDHTLDGWRS